MPSAIVASVLRFRSAFIRSNTVLADVFADFKLPYAERLDFDAVVAAHGFLNFGKHLFLDFLEFYLRRVAVDKFGEFMPAYDLVLCVAYLAEQLALGLRDGPDRVKKRQRLGDAPDNKGVDDNGDGPFRGRFSEFGDKTPGPRIELLDRFDGRRPFEIQTRLGNLASGLAEGQHQGGFGLTHLEHRKDQRQNDKKQNDKDCYGYVFHCELLS